MYLIFSLFLMILGINTAYASVTLGNPVTDPSTLQAGSKIIIRANSFANESNQTYKFFASLADSLTYAVTTVDQIDPYVTFVMETAEGKTVNGQAAYYLKNDYNGRYLSYQYIAGEDGSVYDDGAGSVVTEMRLTFTDDIAKATPVVIVTQAVGGEWMGYTGDAPTQENCMMIIAEFPEHNNDLIAFNCVYDYPLIASYNDWAAWWQISEANIVEDYVADLDALYGKVLNLNFIGGTAPGCYEQSLVDAFTNARSRAEELLYGSGDELTQEIAKEAYVALESAYLALLTGEPYPIREGYFRITSAFAEFINQQGAEAIKTIYGNLNGKVQWKNMDNEDATMVWKFIDRKDGSWLMYNVGTGMYVNAAKTTGQSETYTMTADSTDCGVTFTFMNQSTWNIFPSTYAMHAGGHNSGAGVSGDIVAWNGGLNTASVWYINNVDEAQIPGFEEIGKQNALNRELETLYNEAKAKYDIGSSFDINTDPASWLVTTADYEADKMVAMSNADHNEWHPDAPDGAGIPGLLDDDVNTFWGSCWSDPKPAETPYLQFKLNKAVEGFAVYLTKRQNQPNQATQLDFYVSNDTTNAEGWIKAGSITGLPASTDNSGNGLTYQSNGIDLDGTYQYVRVFWKSANGFTHFTGFHLQEATLSQDCQNVQMGEIADNLKAQLKNAETLISEGKATQEAIDALQAAYTAYVGELADPTELKAKLDSITGVYEKAASPSMKKHESDELIGFEAGQPGVYTDADKDALKAVIDEVQAYIDANDKAGTYTKTDIVANLTKLTDAFNAFKAAAPGLNATDENNEGVWYYISAAQHYFDATGKTPDSKGEGESLQIRKGNVYINADINNDILNNAKLSVTGNETLESLGIDKKLAKWRFVNLGDTAYAIQNQATGLYIGEKTSGNAGLSMTPVAFKISELGYATFLLEGYRFNGNKTNPLHVQTDGQVVVFWDDKTLGSGSCFDIEATTEPANTVEAPEMKLEEAIKGRLYAKSYPISISYVFDGINDGAYPYQIATIDAEKKEMTLTTYEDVIPAGMPFFYICGGTELGVSQEPTAADTTQLIGALDIETLTIAQTPGNNNGLIGNYYNGTKVAKGFGIVKETKGVQSIGATVEDQQMGWNSAYIDASKVVNAEVPGEIVVPLTGNLETAIKDAIIDAQTGNVNVYSVDGILIKKNVKVSEATKGLAKGIYIVGNQKVAVQ